MARRVDPRDGADGAGVFFVILRGPLGVGKSTVAAALADGIGGELISIDRILEDQDLWESGALPEFLRANDFAIAEGRRFLENGRPVVFDGNFYWQPQIWDLTGRLAYRHFIFTLKAPLPVCIDRDRLRSLSHGAEAAREVFAKTTQFDAGTDIDATRPVADVVEEVRSHLR
ncbi:MAG: AAA family ATPase [Thermoplasmata archaeon]